MKAPPFGQGAGLNDQGTVGNYAPKKYTPGPG